MALKGFPDTQKFCTSATKSLILQCQAPLRFCSQRASPLTHMSCTPNHSQLFPYPQTALRYLILSICPDIHPFHQQKYLRMIPWVSVAAMGQIRPAFAFSCGLGGRAHLCLSGRDHPSCIACTVQKPSRPQPLQAEDVPWVFSAFLLI